MIGIEKIGATGAYEKKARVFAAASVKCLEDGKGLNITVLDVRGLTLIADYFIIASGSSTRHVKALADRLLRDLGQLRTPAHIEGYETGNWILVDYGDVIIHIFGEDQRVFYGLERLWGDSPKLNDLSKPVSEVYY